MTKVLPLIDTSYVAPENQQIWYRNTHEPIETYTLFMRYLLTQGDLPTVEHAYFLFEEARDNEVPKGFAPKAWLEVAEKWNWIQRAYEYNLSIANELEAEYKKRQIKLREDEWKASKLAGTIVYSGLEHVAAQIQAYKENPYDKETNPTGAKMPVLRSVDLERYMKMFSIVGRAATGLPTEVRETKQIHEGEVEVNHHADIQRAKETRWQELQSRGNLDGSFGLIQSPSDIIDAELGDE